jgi:hypothetical protein
MMVDLVVIVGHSDTCKTYQCRRILLDFRSYKCIPVDADAGDQEIHRSKMADQNSSAQCVRYARVGHVLVSCSPGHVSIIRRGVTRRGVTQRQRRPSRRHTKGNKGRCPLDKSTSKPQVARAARSNPSVLANGAVANKEGRLAKKRATPEALSICSCPHWILGTIGQMQQIMKATCLGRALSVLKFW